MSRAVESTNTLKPFQLKKFRPGSLALRLGFMVACGALAVPVLPETVWAVYSVLLILLTVAWIELLALRRIRFEIDRPARSVLALGTRVTVAFNVRTSAARAIRIVARQSWPDLIAERSSQGAGWCLPGERLCVSFEVVGAERGTRSLAPPSAAASIWGMIEMVGELGEPGEIVVTPDLSAIRRLHAKLNAFALRGYGSRMSPRMGKGREFERLREYVRGDEFRDLEWKASARHRKLIVREYRLDRSQDVLLCLDCGHRMAARVSGLSKLDHAVNGALLLAYVCNRMEDRVGILGFAADVTSGPRQGRGGYHLRRLTQFVSEARAEFVHSDYLALASHVNRSLRHRALTVLFTALAETDHQPLLRAARMLSPPHLLLVVVLQDPDLQAAARIRPANKAEMCRMLVAQDLWAARQQTIRELRHMGVLVVESVPKDVGTEAMNAYIEAKRRQML